MTFTPRLQLGWNFFSRFSAFAGAGLNLNFAEHATLPLDGGAPQVGNGLKLELDLAPSFFLGVEL